MKRFTETNKWRDSWFRKLSCPAKLIWVFITDNCDSVGMIELDLELMSSDLGVKILEKHLAELSGRIQKIGEGRYFLPKFIEFQYGELSHNCPPHKAIIRLIERHQLRREGLLYFHPNGTAMPQPEATTTTGTTPPKPPDLSEAAEQIYDAYPRKVGKKDGLIAILKALKKIDGEKLLGIVQKYAEAVQGQDLKFIPYPATWFNAENFNDDPAMFSRPEKPHTNGKAPTVFELKTVLEAKQKMADGLKNKFASVGPLTTTWSDESKRLQYVEIRKEIHLLNEKLSMAI